MEGLQIKIAHLEGKSNWSSWKYKMMILLRSIAGAVDIVEGKTVKPEPVAEDATPEQVAMYKSDLLSFEKADGNALLLLTTHMSEDTLEKVMRFTSSREVWEELHRLFDRPDEDKIYDYCFEFFNCKKSESDDIGTHISKLKNIWARISKEFRSVNTCNCDLPELLLICKILDTLPPEYFTFKSSWFLMNKADRSINSLTTQLCAFEKALGCSKVESGHQALVSMSKLDLGNSNSSGLNNNENSTQYRNNRSFKCNYCGIEGHIVRRCPKWLADGKPPKGSKPEGDKAGVNMSLMAVNPSFMSIVTDKDSWYVDNGATNHVTFRKDLFIDFEKFSDPHMITTANGEPIEAVGKGSVIIEAMVEGRWEKIKLCDVWYVPKLCKNLFSVLAAQDRNPNSVFISKPEVCFFKINGKIKLLGARQKFGGLYRIMLKPPSIEMNVVSSENMLQLYHERLGHQNKKHVRDKILNELGIKLASDGGDLCEGCVYGKAHRRSFGTRPRARAPGELIHSDVCGPFNYSLSGKQYFVVFKDDFSRYRSIYFMRLKSEVPDKLKIFIKESQAAGHIIKELLSDNGGEFDSNAVRDILSENGIRQRLTMPYTPQQNGCAERENRTIVETARSLMHAHEDIPQGLWAEMINAAAHILNRSGPSSVAKKSPYELWYGRKPGLKHLRIIGSPCFVHIPAQRRKKMDKKAQKGILVGYDNDDGYRIWRKEDNKIIRSRDVIFEESKLLEQGIKCKISRNADEDQDTGTDYNDEEEEEEITEESEEERRNEENGMELRDRAGIHPPRRFDDFVLSLASEMSEIEEPSTYREAITSKKEEMWRSAMESEMSSLKENKTWILADLPPGKKAIPCKWVYKVKTNPDGTVERYKARLVIKGYSQRKGTDYGETFSPVAKAGTIRALLSIAANEKMILKQFDVSTAFLYGDLEEEIYMQQPEGYSDGSGKVCRLIKSLYGLKQAPRCWNKKFGSFLVNLGFKKNDADPCLFIKKCGNRKLLIALYVDDGLVAATDDELLNEFMQQLKDEFKIKEKDASYFLGLEIERRDDGSIKICQSGYTNKILERFGWSDCRPISTPIIKDSSKSGEENEDNKPLDKVKFPYRQAVGALMYLMTGTRPDISFAVGVASRTLENPTKADWIKVTRIFRYLKETANVGIVYRPDFKKGILEGFSDADHGGDENTGRSTSGVVCLYAGGAISWLSQRQPSVALSTTEAEVVAASEGARELSWLKRLLSGITELTNVPGLHVDNEAATRLAQNPEYHRRTKHIKSRHFFVRELVTEGEIDVKKISTEHQLADLLTKPLHRPRLRILRKALGLLEE